MEIPSGLNGTPITRDDLEEWGERFRKNIEADLIRKVYRFGIVVISGFLISIIGTAVAWSVWRLGVERRVEIAEVHVADINDHGSMAVQGMIKQVDSIRFEMKYVLPGRIIEELEQRGYKRTR